ncbi:DUF2750 domain-containing protein [Asticcacaulis sp. AC460]|uniref:DUF2750 domain-containing protein n=1 Tax=Asticcacaulis sp. AC460 TaxID=1282360 RepID=UPI0009DD32FE|nr:DUF2750 domain-containing protein [Asticcacaulis sp. AC460]
MSIAAAHAHQFFRDVGKSGMVWTIRDDAGFPTSTNPSGETSMPFWSSRKRAQTIVDTVAAYRGFAPHQLTLSDFIERWLPGLEKDGLRVGINWSGARATGYDYAPFEVRRFLEGDLE